jgi:ubiquinone/menaquinone biosynthesis C-methylase UbiE
VDTLISCDIALSYLKRAKAKKIDAGFMRVDVHYLPFEDNSFDTVILTEVLEHVYSPYRVLEEVHRVLNTAGILIISVPNNMTFSKFIQHLFNRFPPDHDAHLSFYDMYGIGRLLNFAGFRIEQRKTAFIYLPVLKRLFYFNGIQNLMNKLFNNFGDKIIIKARKTNQSLWDNY